MQSDRRGTSSRHVAIIMDGNGRWAVRRGEPRTKGHVAGGEAVRRVVEAAPNLGIETLTMFAFAAANWQRPAQEVAALMRLFQDYLVNEIELCCRRGVRLSLVGRRDRLPPALRTTVAAAEQLTRAGTTLHLRLAIDYSSREAILAAAQRLVLAGQRHAPLAALTQDAPSVEDFSRLLSTDAATGEPVPEVDLVIRTGGERRLSDFLLWECAFAELYFTDCMWPDFTADHLATAMQDFDQRDRRFGALSPASLQMATPLLQDTG